MKVKCNYHFDKEDNLEIEISTVVNKRMFLLKEEDIIARKF